MFVGEVSPSTTHPPSVRRKESAGNGPGSASAAVQRPGAPGLSARTGRTAGQSPSGAAVATDTPEKDKAMMAAILRNLMDGSAPWSGAEGRGPQSGRPMSKGMESAHPAGRHASHLGSHVYYIDDTSSRLVCCAAQD